MSRKRSLNATDVAVIGLQDVIKICLGFLIVAHFVSHGTRKLGLIGWKTRGVPIMIERILARLAGSSSFRSEIASSSIDSLSVSDIAYALSGLKPEQIRFCATKYLDDDYSHWLTLWLISEIKPCKYSIQLASLAVAEAITPRICPACKGRQHVVTRQGKVKDCGACHSTGMVPMKKADRARFVGLEPHTWKHWQGRYTDIYRKLDVMDGQIIRHVKRKLR